MAKLNKILEVFTTRTEKCNLDINSKSYKEWLNQIHLEGFMLLAIHPDPIVDSLNKKKFIHIFAKIRIHE